MNILIILMTIQGTLDVTHSHFNRFHIAYYLKTESLLNNCTYDNKQFYNARKMFEDELLMQTTMVPNMSPVETGTTPKTRH